MGRAQSFAIAVLVTCLSATAVRAEDTEEGFGRLSGFEMGARYWYSAGRIGYAYYGDATTSQLASRLTYDKLSANAGEAYFRGDIAMGMFLKGTIGAGRIGGGKLFDEDFPPGIDPYSKTSSDTAGSLVFGNLDLGYSVIHMTRARLGAFVGYGRWQETVNASGCTQLAANPDICVPALPTGLTVIREADTWNLFRVGVAGDVLLVDRLRLSVDAAYVWASQKEIDHHYFTFGLDPSSGTGSGFQVDAIVSYQINDGFNVGLGGRWWHLDATTFDTFDQLSDYRVDRFGVFIQGAIRLN